MLEPCHLFNAPIQMFQVDLSKYWDLEFKQLSRFFILKPRATNYANYNMEQRPFCIVDPSPKRHSLCICN